MELKATASRDSIKSRIVRQQILVPYSSSEESHAAVYPEQQQEGAKLMHHQNESSAWTRTSLSGLDTQARSTYSEDSTADDFRLLGWTRQCNATNEGCVSTTRTANNERPRYTEFAFESPSHTPIGTDPEIDRHEPDNGSGIDRGIADMWQYTTQEIESWESDMARQNEFLATEVSRLTESVKLANIEVQQAESIAAHAMDIARAFEYKAQQAVLKAQQAEDSARDLEEKQEQMNLENTVHNARIRYFLRQIHNSFIDWKSTYSSFLKRHRHLKESYRKKTDEVLRVTRQLDITIAESQARGRIDICSSFPTCCDFLRKYMQSHQRDLEDSITESADDLDKWMDAFCDQQIDVSSKIAEMNSRLNGLREKDLLSEDQVETIVYKLLRPRWPILSEQHWRMKDDLGHRLYVLHLWDYIHYHSGNEGKLERIMWQSVGNEIPADSKQFRFVPKFNREDAKLKDGMACRILLPAVREIGGKVLQLGLVVAASYFNIQPDMYTEMEEIEDNLPQKCESSVLHLSGM